MLAEPFQRLRRQFLTDEDEPHALRRREAVEEAHRGRNTVKRRVDARILAGYKDPVNGRYEVSEKAVEDALELGAALRRSAMLPGAARLRRERIARPLAVQRR